MKNRTIVCIAWQEYRLLWRNRVFRLVAFSLWVLVFCCQYVFQGDLASLWFMLALPSSMPFVNAYLVSVFQSFLVLFSVCEWRASERQADSLEAIRVRPVGNAEYLCGKAIGVVMTVVVVQFVSIMTVFMLNLFGSDSPFGGWAYLFYWLTLSFPALVFCTGLSMGITGLFRKQGVALSVLTLFLIATYWWLPGVAYGILDFIATDLPNVFSDVVGHVGLGNYLLHRFVFLLWGIGLCLWAVGKERRLPNRTGDRVGVVAIGRGVVLFGILCGIFYLYPYKETNRVRDRYLETGKKYGKERFIRVVRHDLQVEQTGNRIEACSGLSVVNCGNKPVSRVTLYLNPGLDITRFSDKKGGAVKFSRENQVVMVDYPLGSGDTVFFYLEYRGKIDERVCYLDVEKEAYWKRTWRNCPLRFGKRYAFIGDRYTLLTPETIWYPVAVPPVNLSSVYVSSKDFTDFRLRVADSGKRTVISQGESRRKGDTVYFRNKQCLTGLTLSMGTYESKTLKVDSVNFELYYFKGHDHVMSLYEGMPEEMLRKAIKEQENKFPFYPFHRFVLLETPVSLGTEDRNWKIGSEFVQPEIVMFPERWVTNQVMYVERSVMMMDSHRREFIGAIEDKTNGEYFLDLLQSSLKHPLAYYRDKNIFMTFFPWGGRQKIVMNRQWVSPLFLNYLHAAFSTEFPVIDRVLFTMSNRKKAVRANFSGNEAALRATHYLEKCSFEEALRDESLSREVLEMIIQLKVDYLIDYIALRVPLERFYDFLARFETRHIFQEFALETLCDEMKSELGIDLIGVLPDWYRQCGIPSYLVKDVGKDKILVDGEEKYRVRFKIFNTSTTDGIIRLTISDRENKGVDYCYRISAGSCKEIKNVVDFLPVYSLNLNLSRNFPAGYDELLLFTDVTEVTDTACGVSDIDIRLFQPDSNELIVDNEDPGFRLIEPDKRRREFTSPEEEERKYVYADEVLMAVKSKLPLRWTYCMGTRMYGEVIRSSVYKKAGNGSCKAEWRVDLPEDGIYEVGVYIGYRQVRYTGEAAQYYELSSRDGNQNIVLRTNMQEETGWFSLGEFNLSAGENRVVLSDRGADKEQVIYADAVKWVRKEKR